MPTIALLHMQPCQAPRRKQMFADLGRASGTDETQHSVAAEAGRLLPLVAEVARAPQSRFRPYAGGCVPLPL